MDALVEQRLEQLTDALAKSDEYQRLQKARQTVEEHEAAKLMLKRIRQVQEDLARRQQAGEKIADAEMQAFSQMVAASLMNPYVSELVNAEAALTDMLWEIQKRVAKAVGIDLPDRPDLAQLAGQGGSQAAGPGAQTGSAPPAGQEEAAAKARSRLWIPGSPGTY